MLEEQLIQTAGFRNVGPEGARTGFQLRVRSPYYRGLWANLIEKPTVTVDGAVPVSGDAESQPPPSEVVAVPVHGREPVPPFLIWIACDGTPVPLV